MKPINKIILSLSLVSLAFLGLAGCQTYNKENSEVKKKAVPIAKDYILNKYNESIEIGDVYIHATGNGLMFAPPDGDAVLYPKGKDYSIYVNTNTNDVGDNKEVAKLKEDVLKEVIYTEFKEENIVKTYPTEPIQNDSIYISKYTIYSKETGIVLDLKDNQYFREDLRYSIEDPIDFLSRNPMIISMELDVYIDEKTEENIEQLKRKFNNIARKFSTLPISSPSGIELTVRHKDEYLGQLVVYNYPAKLDYIKKPEFIDQNWYIGDKIK